MDILKFNGTTAPTKLEGGEVVEGFKSKMWIERYRESGEFTLVARVSTGMRDKLPVGSLISHIGTTEVMIVENHEISEDEGTASEIIITGRSFETYLENRIVGSNSTFPVTTGLVDYVLALDDCPDQIVTMITDHIYASALLDDDNAIPYVWVENQATATTSPDVERIIKRGSLYARVLELLAVDNLGIKTIRPGIWAPVSAGSSLSLVIHQGTDRSDLVAFSHDTGEIESADYLWSIKKLKNCALVSGKWVEVFVDTAEAEYDRRMMHVETTDIDNAYSVAPTGTDLTDVLNAMQQRGVEALAAQNEVALAKAEVSKNAPGAIYRTDFDVGDLITVRGQYSEAASMRVSEYVEIEDETGFTAYPTLTAV